MMKCKQRCHDDDDDDMLMMMTCKQWCYDDDDDMLTMMIKGCMLTTQSVFLHLSQGDPHPCRHVYDDEEEDDDDDDDDNDAKDVSDDANGVDVEDG